MPGNHLKNNNNNWIINHLILFNLYLTRKVPFILKTYFSRESWHKHKQSHTRTHTHTHTHIHTRTQTYTLSLSLSQTYIRVCILYFGQYSISDNVTLVSWLYTVQTYIDFLKDRTAGHALNAPAPGHDASIGFSVHRSGGQPSDGEVESGSGRNCTC